MNRNNTATIFTLIYVTVVVVHSFDVKSFQVSTGHGDTRGVREGQHVDLSCQADNWWEFCTFTSPSGHHCELKWEREHYYRVLVNNCDDFEGEGRYRHIIDYYGDYEKYRCKIRIKMELGDCGRQFNTFFWVRGFNWAKFWPEC